MTLNRIYLKKVETEFNFTSLIDFLFEEICGILSILPNSVEYVPAYIIDKMRATVTHLMELHEAVMELHDMDLADYWGKRIILTSPAILLHFDRDGSQSRRSVLRNRMDAIFQDHHITRHCSNMLKVHT